MDNIVKIPLKNKYKEIISYTIVDKDVYDIITFSCCLNKDGYAQGKLNGKPILLHRFVMNAIKGDPIVDHINNDKLDNRRDNLRFVTHSQNAQNKSKKINTTSTYIGVRRREFNNITRWCAKVRIGGICTEKTFLNEKHAAYWYDTQMLKYNSKDNYKPRINGIDRPDDYTEPIIKENKYLSGVHKTRNGTFQSRLQFNNKSIHLGTFETQKEANEKYIDKKEEIINNAILNKLSTEIRRNIDNIAVIIVKDKEILIDDDKYHILIKYTWNINKGGYAVTTINNKSILMHRYLTHENDKLIVDHINHNKLDNRLENLRVVDNIVNSHNIIKKKNTTSKYIGVYKRGNKYRSEIKKDGKTYYLGSFETEIEAAKTRDNKAIELYGKYANLNTY